MKKEKPERFLYAKLIGILVIPLLFILSYSISDKEISIGNFTLEKSEIGKQILPAENIPDIPIITDTITSTPQDTLTTDTTSQRILFFGDSMLEGLSKRMRQYAYLNGHELLNVIWYSSSTRLWARTDTLSYYLEQFQPTYIILCLGANELFVRDLDKRSKYIQSIIKKIDNKPYIWIGPPKWKEDTGINRMIYEQTGEGRFFPSFNLSFERSSDGAHPTLASASQWMDSIASWIVHESKYPIRLDKPDRQAPRQGNTILLAPIK